MYSHVTSLFCRRCCSLSCYSLLRYCALTKSVPAHRQ